ncbi:MAG: hypothetical protein ABMA25_00460 [Ilumatobacteraceae bacterium]
MATVEILWIPLGAGQHVVRLSGRMYEALVARTQRRLARPLFHSALIVTVAGRCHVIEMTPVPDRFGGRRGVVAEGAVGAAWLGRLRVFRYEIRCWRDGVIPDAEQATAVTALQFTDVDAQLLLALVSAVPTPVWGRDELGAGEMWNSNSVTAWLLSRAGIDTAYLGPPNGGRAPGWNAGLVVAAAASSGA